VPLQLSHTPSRVLGRYAMYEQFAAGGMATLHYGRLLGPSGFSRTVAIKRLHAHLSEDPDFVAMFLDEARLAARIHHPNVIQTLDIESSEGELFVVLDYVHGDSLSRLLRESRRLGEPVTSALAGAILFGALEGLHAAHEARDARGDPLELVHRDVSPHNLLVGTDGIARVLDFGVVKARGRAQTTRVGQFKGKLAYMAPEQLRGTVTRRTDVFAASVVLWEALTGVRLFTGEDDEIIDRLLHRPIPSPREHAPLVTHQLESVVMRGLERDPSRRFATAREMAIALESHAPLATPIEVGAWVERVAGVTLAHRAERVAAIEAESDQGEGSDDAHGALVHPAPHRPTAPSMTGATGRTMAVPGLARTDDRAIHVAIEPMRTGMASVADVRAPRRRRLVGAASLLGVGAVLGVVLIVRACVHGLPEQSASASAQPGAPTACAMPAPLPPPTADSAVPTDSAETHPPSLEMTSRRAPTPQPAPRKRSDCLTPYTIDGRGVRHYKPECL
jgi:hypothetical protein